jgi:uncharacterized protein YecE (DUF72 family)
MRKASKLKLHIGTSNIVLPSPKKHFPPEHQSKTRLGYYATLFNTIEINSTFYKLPRKTTLEKWSAEVPDDFQFTVKLWRQITHNKKLLYSDQDLLSFIDVVDGLSTKKGCLLVQFPASITFEYLEQVDMLLNKVADLNVKPKWRVVVEFRHATWYHHQETYTMLRHYDSNIVYQDIPKSKTPFQPAPGRVVYLRFHGPTGTYRGEYTREELQAYAQRIEAWCKQGKEVYAYFNNTMGAAFENSQTLINFNQHNCR